MKPNSNLYNASWWELSFNRALARIQPPNVARNPPQETHGNLLLGRQLQRGRYGPVIGDAMLRRPDDASSVSQQNFSTFFDSLTNINSSMSTCDESASIKQSNLKTVPFRRNFYHLADSISVTSSIAEETQKVVNQQFQNNLADEQQRRESFNDSATKNETPNITLKIANSELTAIDIKQMETTTKVVIGGNNRVEKRVENIVAIIPTIPYSQNTIEKHSCHNGQITGIIYYPEYETVFSASEDSTIQIWSLSSKELNSFSPHTESITAISMQPFDYSLLSCSIDQHWVLTDIKKSQEVKRSSRNSVGLTCVDFHITPTVFGTGTINSEVKIWDVRCDLTLENLSGHDGRVNSIAFSSDGNTLATAADDRTCKLWDMRTQSVWKIFNFENKINDLEFDKSGKYLACAGTDVSVYQVESGELLKNKKVHTNSITGIRFGDAKSIFSCSLDGSIKLFHF